MKHTQFLKTGKNHCSGFTLIEVLIAIGVLSIGILGMASMQISAINGNATASKLTFGSFLGINRIEKLLALPYDHDDLTGLTYNHDDVNRPLPAIFLLENDPDGTTVHQYSSTTDGLDNNKDGQIDEAGESGNMTIQWNVITDYPLKDTKWIGITVTQGVGTKQKQVSIVTYKMDTI